MHSKQLDDYAMLKIAKKPSKNQILATVLATAAANSPGTHQQIHCTDHRANGHTDISRMSAIVLSSQIHRF
jgi:hypothetical protein